MTNSEVCIVTGGGGLVGKSIQEAIEIFRNANENQDMKTLQVLTVGSCTQEENKNLVNDLCNMKFVFITSKDANLLDYASTKKVFEMYRPTCIIHLAAKVGGLFANMDDNISFFLENMHINENVLALSHEFKVRRGIFCLSTCVFPAEASIPLTEDMLHAGSPHKSNEGYAMAKRVLEMLVRFYREKYEYEWLCVIPTNLYGKFDNFNLNKGHVIPVLIHKCFLAKQKSIPFQVLGSGKPLRQFVYALDLAKILLKILIIPVEEITFTSLIIAGDADNGEHTISKVAEIIAHCMELETPIQYDKSKSDGIDRKTASNALLRKFIGTNFEFTLIEEGIKKTVEWFVENYGNCRK